MAYQLQPGMKIVQDRAIPQVCATEEVFMYPQPSTLNYGSSRPNTMLYGTAPYMAGKGAPAQFIETSDQLRPQSTTQFNKLLVKRTKEDFTQFKMSNVSYQSEHKHTNPRVRERKRKTDYSSKDISIKNLNKK